MNDTIREVLRKMRRELEVTSYHIGKDRLFDLVDEAERALSQAPQAAQGVPQGLTAEAVWASLPRRLQSRMSMGDVEDVLAAIAALRVLVQPLCMCKDRPASECPGEWEQGCDLGSNAAHVRVHEPAQPSGESAQAEPSDAELDAATAKARDELLDFIYEHGTASEGVSRLVRKLARAALKQQEKQG